MVVCYPGTVVSTKAARDVLPASIARAGAVEFAGLLSRFVSALYEGDEADALDGLRDVLAHHVIFHWNRLGLATPTQAVLAHAAADAVFTAASGDMTLPGPVGDVART